MCSICHKIMLSFEFWGGLGPCVFHKCILVFSCLDLDAYEVTAKDEPYFLPVDAEDVAQQAPRDLALGFVDFMPAKLANGTFQDFR